MFKYDADAIGNVVRMQVANLQEMSPNGLEELSVRGHISQGYGKDKKGIYVIETSAKVTATYHLEPETIIDDDE